MRRNVLACWLASAAVTLLTLNVAHADPTLRAVVFGAQSPAVASPGGLVYFPFSVSRTGAGSLTAYLSVSGLPPGATFSFYPPELTFDDLGPSTKSAMIVIRLDPLTPPGDYTISISARKGNSSHVVTTSATLSISGTPLPLPPPVLDIPTLQPDGTLGLSGLGTPLQPILIQATTNLANPTSWTTIAIQTLDERGLFALVDVDSTNYPARFYRGVH